MNTVIITLSPWVLVVDRAPAWCSGGHGFDSCRGLRIFLCPALVSCWFIHILLPNLNSIIFINLSLVLWIFQFCCACLHEEKQIRRDWKNRSEQCKAISCKPYTQSEAIVLKFLILKTTLTLVMSQHLCVISAEQESWVVEYHLKTLYKFHLLNA